MSSEQLGAAQNVLKGNLGGAWDITNGYQDAYTDLGIARRFGGSAAAYSLRDIGAMNGRVVKVRRDLAGEEADAEEDFSASQVDSGALENWVNGKLENTLPSDVAKTQAAYSLRRVNASYGVPLDSFPNINLPSEFGVTLQYDGTDYSIKETGNDFLVNYTGSTVFISPSGNDSSGNGSSASPYKTLDKALTVAANNDKISLASGVYAMPSSDISKSVAIVCPSGNAYIGTFNDLSTATIDTIDSGTHDVYNVDDIVSGQTFVGFIRTDGTLISGVRGSSISSTSDISQDYAGKGVMSVFSGSTSANFVTGTSETLQSLVSAGSILAWTDASTDDFRIASGNNVYVGSNITIASYATNVVQPLGTAELVLDGCEVYGGTNSAVDYAGSGRLLMFNTIVAGSSTDNIDYDNTAIGIEVNVTSSWCNRGAADNVSTGHGDSKVLRVGGTYRGGSRTVHDVNNTDAYVFSCTIGDALDNDKTYLLSGFSTISNENCSLNYANVTFLNTYSVSGITELLIDSEATAVNRGINPATQPVVRIRRSSDDVEVNVLFDSEGKVSASSAISVVSGSTNATTLGNFISGTDAFVHTWYDQSYNGQLVQNDAVQATDANQPKIAESGALLADGIDFDGSNDFLESTGLSSIYTGTDTAASSFIVLNSDAASTTQFIIGAGSTSASNPLSTTLFHSGGNIGWQVRDSAGTLKSNTSATPYVANQMYLVSNLSSGTAIDFNKNSLVEDNAVDADVGAKAIDTVKLGALANGSSSPLNGSIKEAIFYAADQSNNRFRIESNINNYYGLYNDENELSASFTNSGGTLSNESKDGFTIEVGVPSAFIAATLVNTGVSGDVIYASFNADLTGGSGGNADPSFHLSNGLDTSSVSNDEDVVSGFNSFTLTATGDFNRIRFTEGSDNRNFTISDFKVSRIERNGFVPTWYDQSSNGNNAVQPTGANQPKIVSNGALLGGINFDGNTFLNIGADLMNGTDGTSFMVASNIDIDQETFYLSNRNASTGFHFKNDTSHKGKLSYNFIGSNAQISTNAVVADSSSNKQLFGFVKDSNDTELFNNAVQLADGTASQTYSASSGANTSIGKQGNSSSAGANKTLFVYELISYDSDQSSDRSDIENDINNHYNIY